MSLDQSLQVCNQWFQTALTRLPPNVQNAMLHPLVPKALAALLALGVVRQTNRTLSHWSANAWQGAGRWDNARELVLLTGGCSGIGKQMMEDLSQAGVRVVILDIVEPKFELPANVSFYRADITSSDNIRAVAEQIRAQHGDPTVVVNNAGVGHDGTILEEPEAKIRQTFEVNIMSHFWMVREFLPSIVKNNHGHIVTVASMASFVALGEMADYCASKAGALAFHESLTQELRLWYNAPKVRTSVVHPLWVRTPMIQQLTDAGKHFKQPVLTPQKVSAAVVRQILSQRSGQIILPEYYHPASLVRAFPTWLQEQVRKVASLDLRNLREWQKAQGA